MGVVGGAGGKGHGRKCSPRQSVVRLFPVVVCVRDCKGFFLIFSWAQKYWRETHLLDPLTQTHTEPEIYHFSI
jgi:hypothetical protein